MFTLFDSLHYGYQILENHFPDNTLYLNNLNLNKNSIREILWQYENDAELFTLMCLREVYNSKDIILRIPYLPHARMDRIENPSDTFTLKVFCKAINDMDFKRVEVFDVHSNVSLALLDKVKNINPNTQIMTAIFKIFPEVKKTFMRTGSFIAPKNLILFFPDEGAMKRYSGMFTIPYSFGIKDRDWQTGKIKSLNLMNQDLVKDKTILIVDDICSRGGTFKFASEALKRAEAKDIYLYVSHAENTMVEGEMYESDLVKNIFTTDSLFNFSLDTKNKVIKV